MPGPVPKHPSARRRRNQHAGAAKLQPVTGSVTIPPLPKKRRDGEAWHPHTRKRWKAIYSSPMASEYDESDFYGLLDLAHLWDRAHKAETETTSVKLAQEIRMQEQRWGVDPSARRRLHWEIDRGEAAVQRTRKRRNRAVVADAKNDADQGDSAEGDDYDALTG